LVCFSFSGPNAWAAATGEGIVALCDTAWVLLSIGVRLELIPMSQRPLILTTSRLLSNGMIPVGGLIVALWGVFWGFPDLFGLAALIKFGEVIIAKFTAVSQIDREACCAIETMRNAST